MNELPLHKLSPLDEAEPPLLGGKDPFQENFADDAMVLDWFRQNLTPLAIRSRNEKIQLHEEWHSIRNMMTQTHDEGRKYLGRSDAYLPVFNRALSVRVTHIAQALFPTDDYIDAEPAPGYEEQRDVVKAWMKYQFECQMKLRSRIEPFLRDLAAYGVAVGKVWWENERIISVSKKKNMLDAMMVPAMRHKPMTSGARFKTVSVFSWHMWPLNVDDVCRASLVLEDILLPRREAEQQGKRGGWKNLEQALAAPDEPDNVEYNSMRQLYSITGLTDTATSPQGSGELADWLYLTEAYCKMPLPKRAYLPGEEVGEPLPVQILYVGAWPVLVRRNPFWFQRPPYVMQRLNDAPDIFYGVGLGRQARSLQLLVNDFMNQANDNGTYAMNPIVIADPDAIEGKLDALEPGKILLVRDPQKGIKFDRPPSDQANVGLQFAQTLAGYMNDLLGTPPILQGSGTKGAARTATGAQILQQNTKTDLADEVEHIELEVLVPLMEMVHSLGQQYQKDEISVALAGGSIRVSPESLIGDYTFRWLASSQAMNRQMRAQQAMQFLQAVQPIIPVLLQSGYAFDPTPLLKQLYSDGLGFKDFDRVIQQAGPNQLAALVGMGAGTAAMGGGAGGGGGPDAVAGGEAPPVGGAGSGEGGSARSMVDQAGGGQSEMAPGEGEAGGVTRGMADALAAMFGGGGAR